MREHNVGVLLPGKVEIAVQGKVTQGSQFTFITFAEVPFILFHKRGVIQPLVTLWCTAGKSVHVPKLKICLLQAIAKIYYISMGVFFIQYQRSLLLLPIFCPR